MSEPSQPSHSGQPGQPASEDPILRVEVEAASLSELRAFADEAQPDLGCRPVARRTGAGRYTIDAYLPQSRLDAVRTTRAASGVTLTVQENATELGRQRQAEVGRGNRFATRGAVRGEVPRGLGRKE